MEGRARHPPAFVHQPKFRLVLADLTVEAERRSREKERQKSLNWLSSLSFREAYEQRCREHLGGTGSWFTDSSDYQIWKSHGDFDLLWVSGKPGCGKSVLAAVAVQDLKMEIGPDGDVALAYAFCRRADESSQNPSTIFASLVRQITEQRPSIDSNLELEFSKAQKDEKPSPTTLRTILNSALDHFRTSFIVVDALDECRDSDELLQDFIELLQHRLTSNVKIIVFSRHEWHPKWRFPICRTIRPDDGSNEKDLQAYIKWLFPDDTEKSLNQEIRRECLAKADGMFLWVKLLEKNLRKPLLAKQKLKRIQEIPPGLDSLYDRILQDIWELDEDIRSTAFLVLMWVIHARRPLKQLEMLEAVADYDDVPTLKELKMHKHNDPKVLVTLCANLVFIDKDNCFRLCHESVRTYLEGSKSKSNPNPALAEYERQKPYAHQSLAQICLKYMMLEDFKCGPANSLARLERLFVRAPFLAYAAKYWGSHVYVDSTFSLDSLISSLIYSVPRRELSMQIHQLDPTDPSEFWDYSGTSKPLHLLALFGLKAVSVRLLSEDDLSQEADGSGETPWIYALNRGHQEMIIWLSELYRVDGHLTLSEREVTAAVHSASMYGWTDLLQTLVSDYPSFVNSTRYGETPLGAACRKGQKEAAEILLRAEANVNFKNENGQSPLWVASTLGLQSLVYLLLENGADTNSCDSNGNTPLHRAAFHNYEEIASALLQRNADPVARALNSTFETPFHLAAAFGGTEMIKALYRAHPKLDMVTTSEKRTLLHTAALWNSSKSAQTLIDLGASKDEVDVSGATALFIAVREEHLDTVKVLADAKCDVRIANTSGNTPLHIAAIGGKLSVIRHLLRSQPSQDWKSLVDAQTRVNDTVLHFAVLGGNPEIVRLLLNSGANATAKGEFGATPLHHAAREDQRIIARVLLEHTKDANPRDNDMETPLYWAARQGRLDFIVQFFQDCAELGLLVDADALARTNSTAFVVSLTLGHQEVAQFLLKKNRPISVPNIDGDYPIHLAARYGFDSIVEALLTEEGSRCGVGHLGRTPLLNAAIRGHLTTVKLLAESCPETLNVPDDCKRAPVSAALEQGHVDVAHFLLDKHVDHAVVNHYGYSLLHFAAENSDCPMVKRLLKLGCKGDAVTLYKQSPLQIAVSKSSTEVVDTLIAAGFHDFDTCDILGQDCRMLAAQQGDLDMFKKVTSFDCQHNSRDCFGRTAACLAAENGQYEILEFLSMRHADFESVDASGRTVLMSASQYGYSHTVRYLLQILAHLKNNVTTFTRDTALSYAASHNFTQTVAHLLGAGADPHYRNSSGLNALDYASRHWPTMREMHKAGYFHVSSSLELQTPILGDTIRQFCDQILLFAHDLSITETRQRRQLVFGLAEALIRLQDYRAATICLMENLWSQKSDILELSCICDICRVDLDLKDKFVCTSCYRLIAICTECYSEYKSKNCKAPEARVKVDSLETRIQRLRVAIPDDVPLSRVSQAVRYFTRGTEWISTQSNEYEEWERMYNSDRQYEELGRPGQIFIRLLNEVEELNSTVLPNINFDSGQEESMAKLSRQYDLYRREYRADQETREFTCADHEYFPVLADKREALKLVGEDLDSLSGRVTSSFLRKLRERYSRNIEAWQLNDVEPLTERWRGLSSEISRASAQKTTAVEEVNNSVPRSRSLSPSSGSTWKNEGQTSNRRPRSASGSNFTKRNAKRLPFQSSKQGYPDTAPETSTSSQRPRADSETKIQPSANRSPGPAPPSVQHSNPAIDPAATSSSVGNTDSSDTKAKDSEILAIYLELHDKSVVNDDDDVPLWKLAVKLTNIMSPGFADEYVQSKHDELEAKREKEQEEDEDQDEGENEEMRSETDDSE